MDREQEERLKKYVEELESNPEILEGMEIVEDIMDYIEQGSYEERR